MNCIFYYYNNNGSIILKDTITENTRTYYFYTLKQAIKEHRKNYGLRYKHFRIIKL